GVMLDFKNPSMFDVFHFEPYSGAKIIHIIPKSPAENYLEKEDVITEVNGHKIRSPYDLRNRMYIFESGAQINLTIERDGNTQNLQITLKKKDPVYGNYLFVL